MGFNGHLTCRKVTHDKRFDCKLYNNIYLIYFFRSKRMRQEQGNCPTGDIRASPKLSSLTLSLLVTTQAALCGQYRSRSLIYTGHNFFLDNS